MSILQITTEMLQSIITDGIDKDKIIQQLVTEHPSIFMQLLHSEDLVYQIQEAYNRKDSNTVSKIVAIKRYRTLTGVGLKIAKDAVDSMLEKGEVYATADTI